MQIESLRVKSYRSWKVDEVSGPVARERLTRLELFDEMRAEGCSMTLCLKAIKWSRATYYRWQKRYREQGVRGLENRSRRPRRARRRCATRSRCGASARLARRCAAMWPSLNAATAPSDAY